MVDNYDYSNENIISMLSTVKIYSSYILAIQRKLAFQSVTKGYELLHKNRYTTALKYLETAIHYIKLSEEPGFEDRTDNLIGKIQNQVELIGIQIECDTNPNCITLKITLDNPAHTTMLNIKSNDILSASGE
jgi:hypothetical protein